MMQDDEVEIDLEGGSPTPAPPCWGLVGVYRTEKGEGWYIQNFVLSALDAGLDQPKPPIWVSCLNTQRRILAEKHGTDIGSVNLLWADTVVMDETFSDPNATQHTAPAALL